MDPHRFDVFARMLAAAPSRRRGGPCRRDVDCWICYFGKKSKCAGICRDGTCAR